MTYLSLYILIHLPIYLYLSIHLSSYSSIYLSQALVFAGVEGVHDVAEQATPRVQPGQGALLPRRNHLRQRSRAGRDTF